MRPAVVVQGLWKKYSRNPNAHRGFGFTDLLRECFGKRAPMALRADEFYALKGVSCHLNAGDSLACIGRNGSGKTTLLRILNGLIKPDAGTVVMDGRVQALINLGAGFNSALSGRDNIYNSAALMGLSRKQASGIFDAVVAFSELEEFIDTPVGAYSSGMSARLGFSVAITLDPEILLIDEILAVGDYAFRNKCLIRLHQMKKSGVTIVFVSHSPTDVTQLCERALWLERGEVRKLGDARETLASYMAFLDDEEKERATRLKKLQRGTAKEIERKAVQKTAETLYGPVYDESDRVEGLQVSFIVNGEESDNARIHDEIEIDYSFVLKERVTDLNVSLVIYRKDGLPMTTISTLNGDLLKDKHEGRVGCRVKIFDFNLAPGSYVLVMPIHEGKSYLHRTVVKEFLVTGNGRLTWHVADLRHEYRLTS